MFVGQLAVVTIHLLRMQKDAKYRAEFCENLGLRILRFNETVNEGRGCKVLEEAAMLCRFEKLDEAARRIETDLDKLHQYPGVIEWLQENGLLRV
jgi:hypothetical protein